MTPEQLADALDELRGPWIGDGIRPAIDAYGLSAMLRSLVAENAALRAENDVLRADAKKIDSQLSRVLHEMAWAVSLCWTPTPTGVFESSKATGFVADAIAELRAMKGKP